MASTLSPVPARSREARGWLGAILLAAVILRVSLAGQGGQGYWPDEGRYEVTRQAVAAALRGDWPAATERLLGSSDHLFFRFIGLGPALLERVLFSENSIPPGFAAGCFGLFGVGAIGLVWLIARRETGSEATATWCAFFYAGCVSGFYFGRHYFPYDPALCVLLLGWWQGLRSTTARQHWLTGACVGLGYLTYNAYWNFGAVILIAHTLRPRPGPGFLGRASWAGLGLLSPIVGIFAVARLLGHDLLANALEFSHTVTQGGFGHGWRYIPEYFAAAEGGYGALLLVLGAAAAPLLRSGQPGVRWWLFMAALLAGLMIFFSDVVPRFALSGRMVKPLGIFLALAAGLGASRLVAARARWAVAGLGALAVLLAALNFRVPLTLVFPRDFRLMAEPVLAAARARDPQVALQMYYADFIHLDHFITALPPHEVLLQRMHPLQFRPYQYEGFDEPTRRGFQKHDFSMRLVRVTAGTGWQTDPSRVGPDLRPYAGAIELLLNLPTPRPAGHREPLVVAGGPGRGDLVSLNYLDAERVELTVDHWGWGAVTSAPFRIPAGEPAPQRVIITGGSLLPDASHPVVRSDPALLALTRQMVVTWNDQVVLRETMPLYSAPLPGVTVGGNYIGGTTAEFEFTGRILHVRQVDPRLLLRPEWGVPAPAIDPVPPGGGAGPWVLDFTWEADAAGRLAGDAALLTASVHGVATILTVRNQGGQQVLAFWRDGRRLYESTPLSLAPGPHRLEIWSPWLGRPAADAPGAETYAAWRRENLLLRADGETVLYQHAVAPDDTKPTGGAGESYLVAGRPWPLAPQANIHPLPATIQSLTQPRVAGPVLLQARWQDRLAGTPLGDDAVGPLRLRLKFPAGRTGTREPLLSTGRTGLADLLFVSYEADGLIRIGHDHWGWQLVLSEPIAVAPDAELTVDLSLPSLYPEAASPWARAPHTATSRLGRVHVSVNGRTVLAVDREAYLASAASVVVGQNVPGASTCGPAFTGEILGIGYLDPQRDLPPSAAVGD